MMDLRAELHRLRLENQRLHAELEDVRDPTALLARALRRTSARLWAHVRRPSSAPASRPSPVGRDFHPEYRPYAVEAASPTPGGRPRILHAIANFHLGGSSRLVVDLVERLGHRYAHEVVSRDLPERSAYTGITVHHRPQLRTVAEALELLDALRPDLVHVHFLGHHRTAYSARDWSWYHRIFQAVERRGCAVLENVNIPVPPYFSHAVHRYVYVSDSVRRCFGTLSDDEVVIYPGSDLARFSRAGAPVPDDTAGMVYRLEGDKLTADAIDVFVALVRHRPATRVLVVGGGSLLEAYRGAVEKAGIADACTFTGYGSYERLRRLLPAHERVRGPGPPGKLRTGVRLRDGHGDSRCGIRRGSARRDRRRPRASRACGGRRAAGRYHRESAGRSRATSADRRGESAPGGRAFFGARDDRVFRRPVCRRCTLGPIA